jgi:hypothetical protein
MSTTPIERIHRLSVEHRLALDMVGRIRDGNRHGVYGESLLSMVTNGFGMQLERHFEIEETALTVNFAAEVGRDLASRTLAEHDSLRALIADIRKGNVEALQTFADVLEAHVNFEEHELYPTIKACLQRPC